MFLSQKFTNMAFLSWNFANVRSTKAFVGCQLLPVWCQLVSQESLCTKTCFQETVENQPLRSRSVNLSLRRAWFWVSFRLARIVEDEIKEQIDVELIGPLFSSFSSRWVYSIKFKRCSGETSGTGRKFQILNKSYENDYSFDLDLQSKGWGTHRIYCNISCSS